MPELYVRSLTKSVCDKNLEQKFRIQIRRTFRIRLSILKCNLYILGNELEQLWTSIGNVKVLESRKNKLFDVTTDNELKFDEPSNAWKKECSRF